MALRTIRVPPDAAPERVDRYLARALADVCSRTQLQRWVRAGHVRLNGRAAAADERVRPGDTVTVEVIPEPAATDLVPEPIPVDILYEDDALAIVHKPAGLVVHPGAGHRTGTLVHGLLAHTQRLSQVAGPMKPGIVHRLDKDTSGVMVVAKSDAAHRALARQFADRTVQRTYLALVSGSVPRDTGTIEASLGRHPKDRKLIAVQPAGRGREAITVYKVLRRFPDKTLLELRPQTGRTHQLRVHLAHLGYPILGDPRYGSRLRPADAAPRPSGQRGGFPRQALHAWRLGFRHPTTGELVEFTAPIPNELQA